MTGRAKLDAEIAAYEQRLRRVSGDDPGRPPLLNDLAVRLRARFGVTGDQSDLERAIQACREAVAATRAGCDHSRRLDSNFCGMSVLIGTLNSSSV